MTSIRKRGPYQWEARIRKKGMPVTCKTFETKIEAEKWAREIESAATSPEMVSIIKLVLETAMRREEISNLRWSAIDLERRTATLFVTKNGETRTVPLSPTAIKILKTVQAGQLAVSPPAGRSTKADDHVFTQSHSAITQAMRRLCKAAQIEGLHFHDLRHEATSRLFENTDLDVMEIRAITGHKTMQMLARYSHLRMDRLADRLAGKLRG